MGKFPDTIAIGPYPLDYSHDVTYPDLRSPNPTSAPVHDHCGHPDSDRQPNVDSWLEKVFDSSQTLYQNDWLTSSITRESQRALKMSDPFMSLNRPSLDPTRACERPASRTSSNKENIWPSRIPVATQSPSPIRSSALDRSSLAQKSSPDQEPTEKIDLISANPSRKAGNGSQLASRSQRSPTPCGKLAKLPMKKKDHISPTKRAERAGSGESVAVYDDQGAVDSVELSPSVEYHRKCHAHRRKRCPSYWDNDIFSDMEGH